MAGSLWIIYDERAFLEGTDDASVLESCNSEREAMVTAGQVGYVYRYAVTDANELVDETFVGPTKLLKRQLERDAVRA